MFLEVAFTPSLGRAGRLLCTVVKRQQCKLSCVVCSSRGFYFLETNGTGCLFTLRSSPSFIFIMHQSQDFQAIHHQQGALQLLIFLYILYRGVIKGGLGPSNIWISKIKWVFCKRAFRACVNCSWRFPGTSAPSAANLMVSTYLCSSGSNAQGESRVQDADEGIGRRIYREECFPMRGPWFFTCQALQYLIACDPRPDTIYERIKSPITLYTL